MRKSKLLRIILAFVFFICVALAVFFIFFSAECGPEHADGVSVSYCEDGGDVFLVRDGEMTYFCKLREFDSRLGDCGP